MTSFLAQLLGDGLQTPGGWTGGTPTDPWGGTLEQSLYGGAPQPGPAEPTGAYVPAEPAVAEDLLGQARAFGQWGRATNYASLANLAGGANMGPFGRSFMQAMYPPSHAMGWPYPGAVQDLYNSLGVENRTGSLLLDATLQAHQDPTLPGSAAWYATQLGNGAQAAGQGLGAFAQGLGDWLNNR